MPVGELINLTIVMYKKMLLVLCLQVTLGLFISYSFNLLEYLVWTTQSTTLSQSLAHNLDVILIFSGGALLASMVTGMLSDIVSMKKLGISIMVFTFLVLCSLYAGISMKSIKVTLLLYLFVGMSVFSMGTWLLCACSKIFGGKF